MSPDQHKFSRLIRLTAVAEGISYLLLLGIAMPLKYLAGIPEPVKYLGWAHGVLFMLFMLMILLGRLKLRWSLSRMIVAFILSLVPLGTFWLDRKMKTEEHS